MNEKIENRTQKTTFMKTFLTALLFFIALHLFGQTDSIEKSLFYAKLSAKEISQEEFSIRGIKWHQVIKKMGSYPDLPLAEDGMVHFSFLDTLNNASKDELFNRTLEFISIEFGIYPNNLYSNREDGKIIFSNTFSVNNTYSGVYTGLFTIKKGKVLIEFINIRYEAFYPGHYSEETWVPEKTVHLNIGQLYPVILKNPSEWEFNLNLMKTTVDYFNHEVNQYDTYLRQYRSDYSF